MKFNLGNMLAGVAGYAAGRKRRQQEELQNKLLQYQMAEYERKMAEAPLEAEDRALQRQQNQLQFKADQEKYNQEYMAPQFGLGDAAFKGPTADLAQNQAANTMGNALGAAMGIPGWVPQQAIQGAQPEIQDQMNDTRMGPSVMRSTIGLPLQSRETKVKDREARQAAAEEMKRLQYQEQKDRDKEQRTFTHNENVARITANKELDATRGTRQMTAAEEKKKAADEKNEARLRVGSTQESYGFAKEAAAALRARLNRMSQEKKAVDMARALTQDEIAKEVERYIGNIEHGTQDAVPIYQAAQEFGYTPPPPPKKVNPAAKSNAFKSFSGMMGNTLNLIKKGR